MSVRSSGKRLYRHFFCMNMNVFTPRFGHQRPEIEIKFNYFFQYNYETIKVRTGREVRVIRIEDFIPSSFDYITKENKHQLPWIQMFDTGARVSCSNRDPECVLDGWNGCVYMDLDSKAYQGVYATDVHSKIDDFIQSVAQNLSSKPNFYFAQKSISGNSAHFIFYFDTSKKVRGTFERCALYATKLIIGEILSYFGSEVGGDILNTPGVLDPCNEKPAQPLFMSPNPIVWRVPNLCAEPFGSFDPAINDIELIRKTKIRANVKKHSNKAEKERSTSIDDKDNPNLEKSVFNKNLTIDDVCKDGIGQVLYDGEGRYHWTSEYRPNLVRIIRCFLNEESTYELACRVYDQEALFSKRHQPADMKVEMQRAHEDIFNNCRNFDPAKDPISPNVQRNIVDELAVHYNVCLNNDYAGYFALTKDLQEPLKYDKEVTLKSGVEFISNFKDDILANLKQKGNVMIVADCGVGKSYFFRDLMNTQDKVIIISHLNSIKYGVYQAELDEAGIQYGKPTDKEMRQQLKTFGTHAINLPPKLLLGWTQAGILFEAATKDDGLRRVLEEYIKCYDECHNLITTVGYRNQQICDLHKAGLSNNIYVTGTPAGEHKVLPECYCYRFESDRMRNIRYSLVKPFEDAFRLNVVDVVRTIISNHIDTYDNILVYSNMTFRRLADEYGEWAECIRLNKEEYEKGGEDIDLMLSKNVVTKKVVLMTTFGSEGIEFKNNRNKNIIEQSGDRYVEYNNKMVQVPWLSRVLVIFPIETGLTSQVITQVINRYRDVDDIDVMFIAGNNICFVGNDAPYFSYIKNTFQNMINEVGLEGEGVANLVEFYNKHYTHYLKSWCMVPVGYMSQCDVVLKNILAYHNYIVCNSVTIGTVVNMYKNGCEEIDIMESGEYYDDFDKQVYSTQQADLNALLLRYPQAFTSGTSLDARTMYNYVQPQMSRTVYFGESTGNEAVDFFLNPPMQYELPLYYSFCGRLNQINRSIQNIMLAFGADAGGGSTNIQEFYDNNRAICAFVGYLLVAFTYDQECHFKLLKRFVESWEAVKSDVDEIKKTKDEKRFKVLQDTYNTQCKRLGFNSANGDLSRNMYEGFASYVSEEVKNGRWKFDQKTGVLKHQKVGQKRDKFYLLTDNTITFKTKEECHNYLVYTLNVSDVPLDKFKANNRHKQWFGKL